MTRPSNCYELYKLGFTTDAVYEIYPDKKADKPVSVYCEMGLGGWTTIINKVDRSHFFKKPMQMYINGFGNVSASTNYWLGLANMYRITNLEPMTARIELSNSEFDKYFIEYDLFVLGPQIEKFKLTLGKSTFRTITEVFSHPDQISNQMKFSTHDDYNGSNEYNCAVVHNSGWWFNNCYSACLTCEHNDWGHWNMNDTSMGANGYRHFAHTRMLIRPRSV